MLFVVSDWLVCRQRGGVLLCCASQSPFFPKNSGVKTHVSPGRQLDAIYESCPSSPAATRPCGWLRLLNGSLDRWRRRSSIWLATLSHCGPCAIDTRDSGVARTCVRITKTVDGFDPFIVVHISASCHHPLRRFILFSSSLNRIAALFQDNSR